MSAAVGEGASPDADVIVVGAGPTGLMLACELRLGGVRVLVLERAAELREDPKANGFSGRILDLLRHRGLMGRVLEAGIGPLHPAPHLPFAGMHLDFAPLDPAPVWGMHLPQPRLERLLDQHARELGAEIRRGCEVIGVTDRGDDPVRIELRAAGRAEVLCAAYVVGCDGPRSRVREQAGIGFPGTTYPEVNRLAQVTLADTVTLHEDGSMELPGAGRISPGFTRTSGGVFGFGALSPELLMVQTTEQDGAEGDDPEAPLSLAELQASVRRVLGTELPVAVVTRLSRYGFEGRQADRYRSGRVLVAGDAAHQFPATGIGINVGMLDAANLGWKLASQVRGDAPSGLLDSYEAERRPAGARSLMQTSAQMALKRGEDPAAEALRALFLELCSDPEPLARLGRMIASTDLRYELPNPNGHWLTGRFVPALPGASELLHRAWPVLVDLGGRPELAAVGSGWEDRVQWRALTVQAERPADALLIRPDGVVAWAAAAGEPAASVEAGLLAALEDWVGPAGPAPARTGA